MSRAAGELTSFNLGEKAPGISSCCHYIPGELLL